MHSQSQVRLIINHTDQVQHITEVQVQEVLHGLTVRLLQVQATTEAARQCAAAVVAVAIIVEEVAAGVVVVRTPVVPAEVLPEAAVDVHQVEDHLPQVAVNF